MNSDLLHALRLLAQPGAVLVDAWIGDFGFAATFVELAYGDNPIEADTIKRLIKLGYVDLFETGITAKRYRISPGGLRALAAAEGDGRG